MTFRGDLFLPVSRLRLPRPEALEALTGETRKDASAILEYFAPLHDWLKKQNRGQKCGW